MSFLPTARKHTEAFTHNATVVLNAQGAATLETGPATGGATWAISLISVEGQSAVDPLVKIYRDEVGLGHFVDGTTAGNRDTGTFFPPLIVGAGHVLVFTWEGGTPGAQCGVLLDGEVEVGG